MVARGRRAGCTVKPRAELVRAARASGLLRTTEHAELGEIQLSAEVGVDRVKVESLVVERVDLMIGVGVGRRWFCEAVEIAAVHILALVPPPVPIHARTLVAQRLQDARVDRLPHGVARAPRASAPVAMSCVACARAQPAALEACQARPRLSSKNLHRLWQFKHVLLWKASHIGARHWAAGRWVEGTGGICTGGGPGLPKTGKSQNLGPTLDSTKATHIHVPHVYTHHHHRRQATSSSHRHRNHCTPPRL
jgi:hypothetical protein